MKLYYILFQTFKYKLKQMSWTSQRLKTVLVPSFLDKRCTPKELKMLFDFLKPLIEYYMYIPLQKRVSPLT